jgi:hypothetical protein
MEELELQQTAEQRRMGNTSASPASGINLISSSEKIQLELVDIPLLGRKFTWYHASGRLMSRIDRVLISDEWAQRWGNVALWAIPRDVSDHCPLILKYCHDDWGPKPFRFNNFWFSKRLLNLLGVVKGWRGGWGMF